MVQTFTPSVEFCNLCDKKIQKRQKKTICQCCKNVSHFKCNKLNQSHSCEIFMCLKCNQNNLPFFNTKGTSQQDNFNKEFLASENIKKFFKDINDLENNENFNTDESNIDITPIINCKYLEILSLKSKNVNNKSFSLIHLNIHSLEKNKEELESTLSLLDFKFDVIGISETKLKSNIAPKYDIGMEGYKHFSTPSEANKGGVILYILNKHITSQCNKYDKIMYKSKLLESVFAEIKIPNKKNILIACIYRHPSMDIRTFNDEHLSPLFDEINMKKHIFLLGDFNIDLMKTDENIPSTEFCDMVTSAQFVPHIIHPTRITPHSKTLIDNIFSNVPNFSQGSSGNITLALSDHLAQFLIIPLDSYFKPPKIEKFKRDFKNFDRENFLLDLLDINWDNELELEKQDPNHSFEKYFTTINDLIEKYMPLRKMSISEKKYQSKPWIDRQILNLITERDRLYNKYIKSKNLEVKQEYERHYKEMRNNITAQIKQNKKQYFNNYFLNNSDNIKNTWKGIKSIISLKDNKKTKKVTQTQFYSKINYYQNIRK